MKGTHLSTIVGAFALLLAAGLQVPAQTPPEKDGNSTQLNQLAPYRSTPEKEVVATIRFDNLLKDEELSKLKLRVKVVTVWIGTEENGSIRGTNQPVYDDDTPESVLRQYRTFLKSAEAVLEATKPSPEIVIPKREVDAYGVYGLSLAGTAGDLTDTLQGFSQYRLLSVTPSVAAAPKVLPRGAAQAPDPAAAALPEVNRRILPNRGSFTAAQSDQPGRRYVLNWFSWDNYFLLGGFKKNEAYEHQVVLDKYDGQTYLGRTKVWDSNMPGPYLDTTVLNDQGIAGSAQEPDWTVGTYYPLELIPGTWYYTLIETEEGNSATDLGKLTGQVRGYICLDPLCVSGEQDTQYIRRFQRIDLPGSFNWVMPQINSVDPLTIPTGRDVVITLKGKDFDSPFGARIKVGNDVYPIHWGAQTKFISTNEVQVTVRFGNTDTEDTEYSLWLETWDGQISNEVKGLRAVKGGVPPTVGTYSWTPTPRLSEPFGGTITGTGFEIGNTQVWFCVAGTTTCYQQPSSGVSVAGTTSLSVSGVRLAPGSWQIYVVTPAGESARSATFDIYDEVLLPTISNYTWTPTPRLSEPFNGTINGTGFVSGGTEVWFCVAGSTTCYQQPPSGVSATGPTGLTVSGVRLAPGSWQFYVKTVAGPSARSAAFGVSAVGPPSITNYTWTPTPRLSEPFGGTVTGAGFETGNTQVWFCVASSSTCYQQPPSGVSVTSATGLSVSGVRLAPGSWQIYVVTSAGQSARSAAFDVSAAVPPTISGYTWSPTPTLSEPFGGTVTGTGFETGNTQVWFCVASTDTCYQQPSSGVSVTGPTGLTVSGVRLAPGSWQLYVKTSAGQSARSAAFGVQAGTVPSITGFNWSPVPVGSQPFGGTITGTGFVVSGTQVWFCVSGTTTCYQHPAAGVSVSSPTSLTVSGVRLGEGSWQLYAVTSAGQSARSATFSISAAASGPTISGYSWNTTPTANQPFSGSISGTGFVSGGTQVWFCGDGSGTCFQHPSAGVSVSNSASLSVNNVNLSAGSWQFYIQTAAGQSARSSVFTVQSPPASPPTITSYAWNSTPTANQFFGGSVSGSGFVSGGTQVWFCVSGTSTCYQHPSAGVTVNSSTSLSLSNVNLGSGSWQFYVQTAAGQSGRSSSFAVQVGPPTITGYTWSSSPVGNQPFGGAVAGTNFVAAGTQVWFCVSGTSTCYQHPSAGVSVSNSTSLNVNDVRLGTGSWQLYVQTSNGLSNRSTTFAVR